MRRLAAALSALAAIVAVACGGSTFTGLDCPGGTPTCEIGCGSTTPASCQSGQWVCPAFNGPACPADGGATCSGKAPSCDDSCGHTWLAECSGSAWVCPAGPGCAVDAAVDAQCPLVPIHCSGPCGGTTDPICVDGMWQCPIIAGICPADASLKPLSCGNTTCDGNTQFCSEAGGGVQLPDGGSNFTYACDAIPAACAAAPTCACIAQATGNTCPCSQGPDGFTFACLYP